MQGPASYPRGGGSRVPRPAEIWLRPGGLSYDARVAKRIGELLVEGGVLSQSQLEQALFAQRKDGRKLGQLLVALGLVGEIQVTQTLSRQLSVPWVSLYHVDFSRSLLNLVSREVAEKYCVVPIFVRRVRKQGETLYIAMDDPTNESAIEEVARVASLPVKPMIACPSDIRAAIRVYYLGEAAPPPPSLAAVPAPPANASMPAVAAAPSPATAPDTAANGGGAPPNGGAAANGGPRRGRAQTSVDPARVAPAPVTVAPATTSAAASAPAS